MRTGHDSAQERERHDGLATVSGFRDEVFFEIVRGMHFASGDLFGGGSDEAELAAGEAFAAGNQDGRAEDTAGHGAECVDVAETRVGIEGGAGGVIGEVFEAGLVFFGCSEDSGSGVAGEVGGVLVEPGADAVANGFGQLRIGVTEGLHAGVEPGGVEGVDREGAVAALGAAGAAGEPGAGAASGVGEGGVHDLNELGVVDGKRHMDRVSL